MRAALWLSHVALLVLPALVAGAEQVQLGLRVPDGFEVTEFADSKLANDIYRLTVDPRGRIVVSGRGYIRILVDDTNDGRADRAIDFADGPKDGAMGLLWEGDRLYFTGDGGLRRYRVAKDGDRADGPSELIRKIKTGGEHDAHDIRRGPDGWLYVLCGNNAGIDKTFAQLPTSPVKEPVAGCVLRFTPDLRCSEIVADGFRNAYGMDFNLDGELFTYDSDNERCVSLPWYEPTRFYHVIPGGHYGWQSPQRAQTWRMPPYFPDVVAPVAYLERGSPTGVACYRHTQFPERYRGGMFALDWTFGRVWFLPLERKGASYTCKPEVFLEAVGDNGFAPTDAVVHPATGDLFIAIGGRGTRGAVYRVRYPKGFKPADLARPAGLRQRPRNLDWGPVITEETLVRRAASNDAQLRRQALELVHRHRGRFDAETVQKVVRANWGHADRHVRKAAADLIATLEQHQRLALGLEAKTPLEVATAGFGKRGDALDELLSGLRILLTNGADKEARLVGVRLVQQALGDVPSAKTKGTVWEGYTAGPSSLPKDLASRGPLVVRQAFPTGEADLDRELARTLAMFEDDDADLPAKVLGKVTASSHPVEDTHYLIVLARLRGPRPAEVTKRVAAGLIALDEKFQKLRLNRDTNWPLRLGELHAELARKDSDLNTALLNHAEFGRPDHVLFARCPGFDQRKAAEVFLARAAKDEDYPWNAALVELVGKLPEEKCLPVLRRLWERGGLEEALLPVLARNPRAEDRAKFLEGLNSPQLATIRLCLDALDKLSARKDGADVFPVIRTLRRLSDSREENVLREQIAKHLQRVTGQTHGADKQAWTDWFTRTYPDLAARLGGADGVDVAGWQKRLAKLDWSTGDADRGRDVYARAACASCHSGAQALGPDLQGVAGRFSRDDLFTAILQPSKDISPRYRTTLVATQDGKVYQGSVIYEAVDSLILQTGPAATLRVTNNQVMARRFTDTSLMPAGLLDKLTDRDIADLYAYLRSLGSPARNRRRETRRPVPALRRICGKGART